MLAFLIITSSSLAFYVVLLVALHRDSRKRRASAVPVTKIKLGTVAELGTAPAMASASLGVRRRKSTAVLVRFAETARREKLKPQAIVSAPAEGITLPKLDHGKDDLQCG